MAKSRFSFVKLQGTIGGLTFVDSKAYGSHPRLPRGTHKEARLNDVLQKNSDAAREVSAAASPLLRQIKACYGSFVQGTLWQRMVGRMFQATSTSLEDLFFSLQGLEVHEAYPVSRLLQPMPLINSICFKNKLRVELSTGSHCYFPRDVKEDCYYYVLTVLWVDGINRCTHMTIETEWVGKEDALPQYDLAFERPQWASQYLLLLGVQAGRAQRPVERFSAMGVQIVNSGVCKR